MTMRSVFTAAALGLFAASPAAAQSGFYGGVAAGPAYFFDQEIEDDDDVVDIDISYDTGYVLAAHLGYAIQTNVRIEGEVSYTSNEADIETSSLIDILDDLQNDATLTTLSGSLGVYFDLWPLGSVVPYVGAGGGITRSEFDPDGVDSSKQTSFNLFGEAGLPWSLTPELSIVPSARFTWIANDEEDAFAKDLYGAQARIGLRYAF